MSQDEDESRKVKFCKDCLYCLPDKDYDDGKFLPWVKRTPSEMSYKRARCMWDRHKDSLVINHYVVTGKVNAKEHFAPYCTDMRLSDYLCGKEGKHFEPKE